MEDTKVPDSLEDKLTHQYNHHLQRLMILERDLKKVISKKFLNLADHSDEVQDRLIQAYRQLHCDMVYVHDQLLLCPPLTWYPTRHLMLLLHISVYPKMGRT